ncbi:MAG: exo-alpha-sialidase [Planctomycetes bacterium]|nr:exo-alpha-sialidase [Planctomycetota bacterium]
MRLDRKVKQFIVAAILLFASSSGFGKTYREITSEGEWGDYEAFPDVTRAKNGDILVVFYAGYGHVSNPTPDLPKGGRISMIRSTDGGATWGQPQTVVDTDTDDRDPSIACLSDGTLLVSYFTSTYFPDKKGRVCETWVVRSEDNGQTWAEPIKVPSPFHTEEEIAKAFEKKEGRICTAVSSPVCELSDGILALMVYGRNKKGIYVPALVRSRDKGKTWGDATIIDEGTGQTNAHTHYEPNIVELPDKTILCMLRPCMCKTLSRDGGRTWTPAEPIGHRGDAPYLLLTSDGLLLCGHRHPGTSISISADLGKTWPPPTQIDRCGGAYPSLLELDGGRIMVIYYEEGRGSDIRQAGFKIERIPTPVLEDFDVIPLTGKPSDLPQLDLKKLFTEGKVKMDTDMTWTSAKYPHCKPEAAFDGDTRKGYGAHKPAKNVSAFYSLMFNTETEISAVGLCLKPGYLERAEFYVLKDGKWEGPEFWIEEVAQTGKLTYRKFRRPIKTKGIRLNLYEKTGNWQSLYEIELFGR